jgi:hypothetical protein
MRRILPLLALLVLTHAVPAQAGQLKAGLWEIKVIKQVVDGRDMQGQMAAAQAQMQKALAEMPAAQRKQMEAMMKQHGAGMATSGALQVCISPAMAARDEPMVDPDGQCRTGKVTRSGNRTRFEVDCVRDGQRMTGTGETVHSGNTLQHRMDMTFSDAQGRHSMQTESRMTWVGANCGAVKPVDRMVSDLQKQLR